MSIVRRIRLCHLAPVLALAAFALMLLTAPGAGAANPSGYWKVQISIDYTSTGAATDPRCYPNPEEVNPSPVSGDATQKISVRTLKPTTLEFHEAPNGVPVAGETNFTRGYRGKISETRGGDLSLDGSPTSCLGGQPRKTDCGTRSVISGLYVSPLGGIHSWRGFVIEFEQTPQERFQSCGLSDAQHKLDPLRIEIPAKPSRLTSRAAKLVFRDSVDVKASTTFEGVKSSATGKLNYTIKLTRASIYS
jgi:hypothetical protein